MLSKYLFCYHIFITYSSKILRNFFFKNSTKFEFTANKFGFMQELVSLPREVLVTLLALSMELSSTELQLIEN